MEMSTDLLARAGAIIFLIGITPQGTISYISKCSSGDKEIVERSDLLDHLLPGQ